MVRAARRAPLVAVTAAVAVLVGICLLVRRHPPGRVRSALKELGAFAITTWGAATDSQRAAAARLPWVKVPAGRMPFLEERCARILARVTGTLSADELHEQLRHDPAQPVPSVAEVREVLTGHPAVVQVSQGRWHLGEPEDPAPELSQCAGHMEDRQTELESPTACDLAVKVGLPRKADQGTGSSSRSTRVLVLCAKTRRSSRLRQRTMGAAPPRPPVLLC